MKEKYFKKKQESMLLTVLNIIKVFFECTILQNCRNIPFKQYGDFWMVVLKGEYNINITT